jgi:nucleotide-binding universal stress UspA family protein
MEASGTQLQEHPYRVVVGIDFSSAGGATMLRAMSLANAHAMGEVHAVAVLETEPVMHGHQVPPDAVEQLQEMARNALTLLAKSGEPERLRRVVTHLLTGSPAHEIIWLAAHLDADLIVVGTHGRRGVRHLLLGSVAEQVVKTAGCPVLVERAKSHPLEWREPEIEPPCPDCVAHRKATNGAELWCKRHSGHHPHAHVYSWSETNPGAFKPWGFVK